MELFNFRSWARTLLVYCGAGAFCAAGIIARGADCLAPPDGLVSWWAGNGDARDQAGVQPGDLRGVTTFAPGLAGPAFKLNGASDYIYVADGPALRPAQLTVAAWINAAVLNPAAFHTIISRGTSGSFPGMPGNSDTYFLGIYQRKPYFGTFHAVSGDQVITATNVVTTNEWHFLAASFDGQTAKLYYDGVLATNLAVTNALVYDSAAVPVLIGEDWNQNNPANIKFNGLIDEVDLYSRALSDAEIQALYNAGGAGKCGGSTFAASVPYFTDFETGCGAEWSILRIENSEPARLTKFLGRHNNSAPTLTLTGLTEGQVYTLGFDLYTIDSWDGGNATSGDVFFVMVNGNTVLRESFSNFGAQSFARAADEGREHMGFNNSWPESIYRYVEVTFTASNSMASLAFGGANLEAVDNESWGVDNVRVQLASDLANPFIHSTTLPSQGSTNYLALDMFAVAASGPLSPAAATNAANWSLREAGPNGTFDDGDDVAINLGAALAPNNFTGRSVLFTVATGPLPAGRYRFQSGAGLVDTNNSAVAVFTREFAIAHPVLGRIESPGSDSIPTATALPLAESPAGTGFLTAFGAGNFSAAGDNDYWRFDAEAGDRLTARLETLGVGTYPQLYLQNVSGGNLRTVGGNYEGVAGFQDYVFSAPGTYYARVWNDRRSAPYQLRLDVARGLQMESENNDSPAAANLLNLSFSAGVAQGRVAGALPGDDPAGDCFNLSMLNPGNSISVTARFPDGSTLDAGQLTVQVLAAGNTNALAVNSGNTLNYTVADSAVHYLRVTSASGGIRHQYVLNVAIGDGVAPVIAGTTLPAEGEGTGAVLDRFTLNFSEEITPAAVTNQLNYEARGAGRDGNFGTADDEFYTVAPDGYTGGLAASYTIIDGPLQPGLIRVTVRTNLMDRAGNPMAAPFARTFTVTNAPGFQIEARGNDIAGGAGYFTPAPGAGSDGTFSFAGSWGTASGPHYPAGIYLEGNTNLHVAVPNYYADNISILTNDGRGIFQTLTNVATGNGPVAVAVARLDGDTNADLAVANYSANTVAIVLAGGGGFQVVTNLTGFSTPYQLAAGDFNGDGKTDLAVPNYNGGNVRVVLGNGDGTFQAGVNYPTPGNPMHAAIGDLNGDAVPDLAVACYAGYVSLLFGNGDGTFQAAQNLPSGGRTRSVAIGDVTGDGVPDLVSISAADVSLSVFRGHNDGSFDSRREYPTATSEAYQVVLGDLNGDGRLDAVVPGYYNDNFAVLLNDGAGGFDNLVTHGLGQSPLGAVLGDFDNDGRMDILLTRHGGSGVSLFKGNAPAVLAEDPPGSGLRHGFARGNLTSDGDVDFYRFTGTAGDQTVVAVEAPGAPASSGMRIELQRADGGSLTSFYTSDRGWGQSGVVTLPYTGTYLVRVSYYYSNFRGEYRVRVTTLRPPDQFESEDNNSVANADAPVFAAGGSPLQAALAGYLSRGDGAGDYYNLGVLAGGTTVTLGLRQPESGGFAGILTIFNAAGQFITNSAAGATNFTFVAPAGASSPYYARLTADPVAAALSIGGQTGFALLFDGNGQYARVPDSPSIRPVNLTIEGWVNFSGISGTHHLFAKTLGGGGDNSYVVWYDSGALRAYCTAGPTLVYNWTPELGRWYHVAFVFDDAANTEVLYVDAQPVASNTINSSIGYDAHPLLIGADHNYEAPYAFFSGKIDEVRLWNVVRASNEIAIARSQRLEGNEPGLVGYWRFDEGTGLLATDATGNENNGSLVNNPVWASTAQNANPPMALAAQYLLAIEMEDTSALQVTGLTLPAEAGTVSNLWQSFTVSVNKELDPRVNRINRNVLGYGANNYVITDGAMTWYDAEAFAVSVGGHLATINDADENTWVWRNFSGYGDVWIGLNDRGVAGVYQWAGGEAVGYTNWYSGQPDNNGAADAVWLDDGSAQWLDDRGSGQRRAVVEMPATPDADGDGLPDGLDLYPADPRNGLELRCAGLNGVFDDADDLVYRLNTTSYASGTNLTLNIVDGPLQAGLYRFTVTTAFSDRLGNGLAAPYIRTFTIGAVPGYVMEDRDNNSRATATSLGSGPAGAFDGSFSYGTNFAVNQGPHYIIATNLNADTNLDLLVAHYYGDNVAVLLGRDDGSFQQWTNLPADSAVGMLAADFTGDGKLDFVVANHDINKLSLFAGDGAGNFSYATNYVTPALPYYLAGGDFNQDGKADMVNANYNGGNVSVFLGNGDGTFQPRADIATGSRPVFPVATDLNGDGNADIIIANYSSSTLTVLPGRGDGSFESKIDYPTSGNPRGVAAGDLNGDGLPDVVVICSSVLNFFPGQTNGTLGPRVTFDIGTDTPHEIDLVDLDGNGTLDLVIPNYGNNSLATVVNYGNGTFGGVLRYGIGGNPLSVAEGDFNHDGRLDLVTANYSGHTVQVLLGVGAQALALDAATGLRKGAGRGMLFNNSDVDYWSFSGQLNDRLTLAVENPGAPANSALRFYIYRPDGSQMADFYQAASNGAGEYNTILPASGTYTIYVTRYHDYYGEYRLRVTLAPPPLQYETEDNNTLEKADPVVFALMDGKQTASVYGYFSINDSYDYYRLGNLSEATAIILGASRPLTSGAEPWLGLYNAAGVLITNGLPGETNLTYIVGPGEGGAYFARLQTSYPSPAGGASTALRFDGANDYVNTGSWSPGTRWTVQAWVMPLGYSSGRRTMAGSAQSCVDWGIVTSEGRFGVGTRPPGGCSITYVAPDYPTLGVWHHVAGVCDGTNAYLYVNGVLRASGPVDLNYTANAGGTWFGGEICCGNYWPGMMQEVSIWNRALAPEEIAGSLAANLAGNEANLVGYWPLREESGAEAADLSAGAHHGTLVNGPVWTALGSPAAAGPGLFAEYRLDFQLADIQPPFITDASLPGEGTESPDIWDRFTLGFSEDLAPATVNSGASYELRHAGLNGLFDDADDALYTVANSPAYANGLSGSFLISDGPLQPGAYRFTALTNLTDTSGTRLASNYVRRFVITGVPGYVNENRNNGSAGGATSFSWASNPQPDGSFTAGLSVGLPSDPEYVATGHLDSDTNLDLVIPSYGNSTISVYAGNGNGTFQLRTNFAGGNGGLTPVLADFNHDGHLDLAVGDYLAHTISIYLGGGDGTFARVTNYAVGARPVGMAAADFNQDGRIDLACANYNGNSVSVLLGNGDGTFLAAVHYAVPGSPHGIATGDLNGDGRPDLLTANYNTDNLTLLLGNGDGTFAVSGHLAVNGNPRDVAIADFNGDERPDLVSANYDNTVSILFGNGDGTFQARVNYGTGGQNQYQVLAEDWNGDGRLDLAVSAFDSARVSVLLNRGDGRFEPAPAYQVNSQPLGMAAGDFNRDGRKDLVVVHYGADNFLVLFGNDSEPLQPDDAAGLVFAGRGRGNRFDSSDSDYWSFTASAGERLHLNVRNPGDPAYTGHSLYIYKPDNTQLGSFTTDYRGWGTWSGALPMSGTYTIRVSQNYTYTGEYRLAIWTLKAPLQVEYEDNNSTGQANAPAFETVPGRQTAQVFGTVLVEDDYFRLGNLAAGATIQLSLDRPLSSTFAGALAVYKGGTLVTNGPVDQVTLGYTIPAGGEGVYYARVSAAGGAAGLLASYILNLELNDSAPPVITGIDLPGPGATSQGLYDHFTLNFNQDLDPAIAQIGQHLRLREGRAYFVTSGSMTWLTAEQEAIARGGHLATINDAAENDWVRANFSGTLWLGLNDAAQEGVFGWASGESVTYTNWNSGQPDNSGNSDYAAMDPNGKWYDHGLGQSYTGLIEVDGPDSDGDGIPDAADPYPSDPFNLFDLRAAGEDGLFDTGDDQVYRLAPGSYSGGLSLAFGIPDGPLQPGQYRFRVTTSLRDRFGNALPAPLDQFFVIAPTPPFTVENRANNAAAGATPLAMNESPTGLRTGFGRGKLFDNNDVDYWSFSAQAGDILSFATEVPGQPGASELRYEVLNPDGVRILNYYPGYYGTGQAEPVALTTNGVYLVRISLNYGFHNEHRFRVSLAGAPMQVESEGNDSLANADALALAVSGDSRFASMLGAPQSAADLDYYNLGTLTNGSSVFLSVRLPGGSAYVPVVSLYNAANQYQPEANNGSAGDSVAEVRITATGTYYALVRGAVAVGDLQAQYILDVQAVPTGAVSFPNLIVTAITLPAGAPQSGQPVSFTFTVANAGALATPAANWLDRAAFSANGVLGDADDIPLGFFPRFGALDAAGAYSVTNTFTLPDGVSGDYYLIVQTDAGNAVNEFVFEADNITVSPSTFRINRAPYPDLRVEDLALAGPDAGGVYAISWTTANRGNAAAPGGFHERFRVRNLTTGVVLANDETLTPDSLAANGTLARLATVTTTNPGNYQVEITTDSRNAIYEFDAVSHASAEQNTAFTNFAIIQFFAVSVTANPPGAGFVSGGGNWVMGSPVAVTAMANTNELPYYFVNWTENGVFQSAATNYTFTLTRARQLTANFTLPAFVITASNYPPAGGTVSGQGTYFYGATNVLRAAANAGYLFTNWTENGVVLSSLSSLTNIVTSNRFVVANYEEANTFHVATTETAPAGLAALSGAGVYLNGQSAEFAAPLSLTNPPYVYSFREWRVNGALAAKTSGFTQLFSTLDPTNMQFVAHYDRATILPIITNMIASLPNPVPATTNFVLRFQFNRGMSTNPEPLVLLTNGAAPVQALVRSGGIWSSSVVSNDTYATPPITFSAGMDGTNQVLVSRVQDLSGFALAPTNAGLVVVDVTPPAHPVLTLTASNSSSAMVSWAGYAAPADLGGFRVYLSTNSMDSIAGLTAVNWLSAGARSYTYYGLQLDRPYYAAVAAVDVAGNSLAAVTPLAVTLPSSLPPPVAVQVTAIGGTSAQVSWNAYNAANLLGLSGFRLYVEETNFTSVAGLAAKQTLGAGARSAQVDNLDRTRSYYFAVVGYNVNNAFNPAVTSASWSDPFAGDIAANLTISSPGQVVDIYQSITVVSNAALTIPAGTVLRFAPGTGLTVQQGRLNAPGTALDPIILTAREDAAGGNPAPGAWNGITLGSQAGASVLRHVFVKYGAGLVLDGCSPTVEAFSALYNIPAGLSLKNGARLTATEALVLFNGVGAWQEDTAQLTIRDSVIKSNGTNAWAAGGLSLVATQNWWGSGVAVEIDALLAGTVNRNDYLLGEPLLTPAIGISNNVTQVGSRQVTVKLACRTAESARVSEDSTFSAVFFQPFTTFADFQLSDGGGQKTVFAQFRSLTGQNSAPVSVAVTYITAGPTITGFNLSEGQRVTRPMTVTGSATAPLGMAAMEFYVDNVLQGETAGGNLSLRFDVRGFSEAVHRVKLAARDASGNMATREANVVIAPAPPAAPVIAVPAGDVNVNNNTIEISGTAEPLIEVRLTRNAQIAGLTTAGANGAFAFPNLPLIEGLNEFQAVAFDTVGSSPAAARRVRLDSGAPAPVLLDPPSYTPNLGLTVNWRYASEGERPSRLVLYWDVMPFATTNQAGARSIPLTRLDYLVQGLADGDYYFGVVGFDDAGNASALSDLVMARYDASMPQLSLALDKASPVGVGPLQVTLRSEEPLAAAPTLTLRPSGGSAPVLVALTNVALNTYQGVFNVTADVPSGLVGFYATARDLAGNAFSGPPAGAALVIDVAAPVGRIVTAPSSPVQTTNNTEVAVNLILSEAAKQGTTPSLAFSPPTGAKVPVALSGAGSNWSGALTLTAAMGSGFGQFSFAARDAVDNAGSNLISGAALEIYNTEQPTPPAAPAGLQAVALAGGHIRLSWNTVSNAEVYHLYREAGTNTAFVPAELVASGLTATVVTNTPLTNGPYRFAVTASRREAEGTNSNVVVAVADSEAPPAPINVAVQLVASGVRISWEQPDGDVPQSFRIYRNGSLIRTVNQRAPVIDSPPRGTMNYTVSAVDAVGNENLGEAASIQLLVGAVNNLQVLLNHGQAPSLSWVSGDPASTGFNVYRNGIKQNATPLAAAAFTDLLPVGTLLTTYSVTALNAAGQESAPRLVNVYQVQLSLLANPAAGSAGGPPVVRYFDQFQVGLSNLTSDAVLPLRQLELLRTIPGADPLAITRSISADLAANSGLQTNIVVPGASLVAAQQVRVRAVQETDVGGSSVIYQRTFAFPDVALPSSMVNVSANQLPLAGGLNSFLVQFFNRGYVPLDIIVARDNGAKPGDVYISVKNAQGQEVGRTTYTGVPPGATFLNDGRVYVRIPAQASLSFTVPQVLVAEALADTTVTFEAVAAKIYYRLAAADEQSSGPLVGSTTSGLAQTPYYGTAQTSQPGYANHEPVIITGQALDRATGLPVANAALKIGFATRGYRWYRDILTDAAGNYRYEYEPSVGFGGTLSLWAAHPLVFDQLNQAQVTVYRLYVTPQRGDIRMSKNDSLEFSLSLINPGDTPLTGFVGSFRAYRMEGTNEVDEANLSGTVEVPEEFSLAPGQTRGINLRLFATADAPDNAVVEYTIRSAEGAAAVFQGNVTLLPAVPVVTVVDPRAGYLEVSVNRGNQVSRSITVVNRGHRDLQGVELIPPADIAWMAVNLPVGQDGKIRLPDLKVGESNSFQVVFTPPVGTALDYFHDTVQIKGTNAAAVFTINVYARVTSDQNGHVQFFVDNILSQDVPNAAVRLRNTHLQVELPPVYTDENGLVTVTNLQEGIWSWRVEAPGHSANVGLVEVIPGQTIRVDTRLNKSVVTISFSVVPVPYTDRYEIKLEQTFETHVPVPVLVLDPNYKEFNNVQPGFEANFIVTARNHGLIQMENLTIKGSQSDRSTFTPLITYVPVLRPQEVIEIPFRVTYSGTNGLTQQGNPLVDCLPNPFGGFDDIIPFTEGLRAIANAEGRCVRDNTAIMIAGAVALTMKIVQDVTGIFASVGEQVASYIGCVIGSLLAGMGDGGGPAASNGQQSVQDFRPTGPPCFVADTMVWMADGTHKPIQRVKAGDWVRSGLRTNDVAMVTDTFERTVRQVRTLTFDQPAAWPRIESSDEHLFWVDGKGWTAAWALRPGDWLTTEQGVPLPIASSTPRQEPVSVYTFKLREDSAFFANGVLVHDLCGAEWTKTVAGGAR